MLQSRGTVHGAYFNIEKGERGVSLSTKRIFFQLGKNADTCRKCLLCSNVSILLSMIVACKKVKFYLSALLVMIKMSQSACEKLDSYCKKLILIMQDC